MNIRLYIILICFARTPVLAQFGVTSYGLNAGKNGTYNTHVGIQAGQSDIGFYNTFMGAESGSKNTGGNENTFIGAESGKQSEYSKKNVFIGSRSGYYTTYAQNTFIGFYSGFYNTIGSNNTFMGYYSGLSNRTGVSNVFFGSRSGYNNTAGNYNTFIGDESGFQNVNGHYSVSIGHQSGYRYGYQSIYLGHKAGYDEIGAGRLYIANKTGETPLIYGDLINKKVSIGSKYTGSEYQFIISGPVRASRYDVVSDERLKQDVRRLDDVLTKVQRLGGVSYVYWRDELASRRLSKSLQYSDRVEYGLLAQNVKKIFPELVSEDLGILAVNYHGMIPVLVEALKLLATETNDVVQSHVAMGKKIDEISKRMERLKKGKYQTK